MGNSASAHLAFGFSLGNKEEDNLLPEAWRDEDFDFDILIAQEAGLGEPEAEYSRDNLEWQHYLRAKAQITKACPLEFLSYGHYDYPYYFLGFKSPRFTAWQGNVTAINNLPVFSRESVDAFKAFCERHDVPWQEPNWYLMSDYG